MKIGHKKITNSTFFNNTANGDNYGSGGSTIHSNLDGSTDYTIHRDIINEKIVFSTICYGLSFSNIYVFVKHIIIPLKIILVLCYGLSSPNPTIIVQIKTPTK